MKYDDLIRADWRQWAVYRSCKINKKHTSVDRILEDARKLEAYVNGQQPAEIVLINNIGKEKANE